MKARIANLHSLNPEVPESTWITLLEKIPHYQDSTLVELSKYTLDHTLAQQMFLPHLEGYSIDILLREYSFIINNKQFFKPQWREELLKHESKAIRNQLKKQIIEKGYFHLLWVYHITSTCINDPNITLKALEKPYKIELPLALSLFTNYAHSYQELFNRMNCSKQKKLQIIQESTREGISGYHKLREGFHHRGALPRIRNLEQLYTWLLKQREFKKLLKANRSFYNSHNFLPSKIESKPLIEQLLDTELTFREGDLLETYNSLPELEYPKELLLKHRDYLSKKYSKCSDYRLLSDLYVQYFGELYGLSLESWESKKEDFTPLFQWCIKYRKELREYIPNLEEDLYIFTPRREEDLIDASANMKNCIHSYGASIAAGNKRLVLFAYEPSKELKLYHNRRQLFLCASFETHIFTPGITMSNAIDPESPMALVEEESLRLYTSNKLKDWTQEPFMMAYEASLSYLMDYHRERVDRFIELYNEPIKSVYETKNKNILLWGLLTKDIHITSLFDTLKEQQINIEEEDVFRREKYNFDSTTVEKLTEEAKALKYYYWLFFKLYFMKLENIPRREPYRCLKEYNQNRDGFVDYRACFSYNREGSLMGVGDTLRKELHDHFGNTQDMEEGLSLYNLYIKEKLKEGIELRGIAEELWLSQVFNVSIDMLSNRDDMELFVYDIENYSQLDMEEQSLSKGRDNPNVRDLFPGLYYLNYSRFDLFWYEKGGSFVRERYKSYKRLLDILSSYVGTNDFSIINILSFLEKGGYLEDLKNRLKGDVGAGVDLSGVPSRGSNSISLYPGVESREGVENSSLSVLVDRENDSIAGKEHIVDGYSTGNVSGERGDVGAVVLNKKNNSRNNISNDFDFSNVDGGVNVYKRGIEKTYDDVIYKNDYLDFIISLRSNNLIVKEKRGIVFYFSTLIKRKRAVKFWISRSFKNLNLYSLLTGWFISNKTKKYLQLGQVRGYKNAKVNNELKEKFKNFLKKDSE